MNRKNTLSILLAAVIAFTALAVFSNTVSADQTGPQEPGAVETTEPEETSAPPEATEPPETTSPAPEYDFSSLPDATYSVAHSPKKITSGGYTNIPCRIDLVFGKVADDKIAGDLELNFDRKGEILDKDGNRISDFEITNAEHNLSGSSALTYKFSYENDGYEAEFAFAVNIDPLLFNTLAPGKYTANVHYSGTWKNVVNTETLANEPAVAGPEHVIPLYILVIEKVTPTGPASYSLSPREFVFDHGGYVDINCSLDSFVPGKLTDEKGIERVGTAVRFTAKTGKLKDNNNHSVDFVLGDPGHTFYGNNLTDMASYNSTSDNIVFTIYIKPSDLCTLPAGTYRGELRYDCTWLTTDNTTVTGVPGSILLWLVVPETYIVDSGKCGATKSDDLTWTLYSDGRLEITGTGEMKDYTETTDTSPWRVYREQILTVKIGNGVTKIGSHAFYYLDEIVSAEFSSSIKTIGSSAFANCGKLSGVVIPDSVSEIGSSAFFRCKEIDSMTIPDNVTSIGRMAFYETGIKTLTIGSGLTAIAESAFNSTKISSVDIPSTIKSIGDSAFMSCRNLASVTLHDGLVSIGANAFSTAVFTTITIPDTVTSIGDSAFSNCLKLSSIKLSSRLTAIEPRTFFQCKALESVTIPANVLVIGSNAFYYCEELSRVDLPYGLVDINSYAFKGCKKLASLELPGSLTTIGAYAFDSSGLVSLVIPDSVTTIGAAAFYDNKELTSITLPKGLTTIKHNMFRGCVKLESIDIPSRVKGIELYAFGNCDSLTSVTIPQSVTKIESYVFESCDNLKSVDLPTGITVIDSNTFSWCKKLESINIPNCVTTIYQSAFYGCESLEKVTMPDELTAIWDTAFWGCTSLKSIVIPSKVKEIRSNAFTVCTNLSDVYCYADPDALTWNSVNGGGFKSGKATKCHVLDRLSEYEEKFSDINVTFVLAEQIDIGGNAHLYGYTLSLAGDIGVNFWMKLDDACAADDNYMLFTVNSKTQKVKVSEADIASNSAYKVFRCGVAAKEMTDIITAQFYLANGTAVGSAYTYTVREYANYILTHDSYAQKAKDVAKAMLNYGACSQKYFNYHTDSLANSVLPENERFNQISSPDAIGIKTPGEGCLTPVKVSLSLKSTVTLKLYFNSEDAEGKIFKSNGKTFETVKSGGYTVVIIDNISASHIHSGVGFDVYENDAKIGSVLYSPAKYIKIVLGMPTDNVITDDLKLAVSSLYNFNQALQYYIQSISL